MTCRDRVLDVNDGQQGFTIDWRSDWPEYTYYDLHGSEKTITGREGLKDGKLHQKKLGEIDNVKDPCKEQKIGPCAPKS